MTTSKSEKRTSAGFTPEQLEEAWGALPAPTNSPQKREKPAIPKLKLVEDSENVGSQKQQDKLTWHMSASGRSLTHSGNNTATQTVTQTVAQTTTQTTDLPHSEPVITPRKQLRFAPESGSDGGPGQEKKSARSEKIVDSPRRQKIQSKGTPSSKQAGSPSVSVSSSPMASPAVTPREKNEIESPRSLKAAQLRKNISKKFSKVALDLSKLGEKFTSEGSSPPSSPGSTGRASPSKMTPRKKESTFIKSLPCTVRNSAAKCLIKLQKEDDFINAGAARKKLMLNASLIGILSDHEINYDRKKLEALAADAENRSKNHSIDMEIDLTKEPHQGFLKGQVQFLEKKWREVGSFTDGSESTGFDRGNVYTLASNEEKKNMNLCFSPYFLRDFLGGMLTLAYEDDSGRLQKIKSLEQFEIFLNEGDPESDKIRRTEDKWQAASDQFLRSKYITHFSSQLVSNVVGAMAFGIDASLPSYVKLHDGTPIIPKGDVKIAYVFRKTSDGGMDMRVSYELKANVDRVPQLKDGGFVTIDPEATATASLSFRFSKDRDFEISPLRLKATGWTLELEGKKFGK